MTLLDVIEIPYIPDTARISPLKPTDTIAEVDTVTVQLMDVAPPPSVFDTLGGGGVWEIVAVVAALCACLYLAWSYRRSHKA